jgi:hypothetical protein
MRTSVWSISDWAGLHVKWNQKRGLENVGLLGLKVKARVGCFNSTTQ